MNSKESKTIFHDKAEKIHNEPIQDSSPHPRFQPRSLDTFMEVPGAFSEREHTFSDSSSMSMIDGRALQDDDDNVNNFNLLPPGWICMEKNMTIEEVEFEEKIKCSHIFQESCFTSYKTLYKTIQVTIYIIYKDV